MKIIPSIVIADLEEYLGLFNVSLSKEARETLLQVEEFGYRCDYPVNSNLFFSKIIRNSEIIQNILMDKGINPNLAAVVLEKNYYDNIEDATKYRQDNYSYSQNYMRKYNQKTDIIDRALECCVGENRTIIHNIDIFLAAMDHFENTIDSDDIHWSDKGLDNSYITLSHLCGYYNKNLWIKFDDIRGALMKFKKSDNYIKIA